jgi:hypothetical protein
MKTVTSISTGNHKNGHEIRTNRASYIIEVLKKSGGVIQKEYISQGVRVVLLNFGNITIKTKPDYMFTNNGQILTSGF